MAQDLTPQFILWAIRERIAVITDEECKRAQERVAARVAEEAATIAVSIMRQIVVSGGADEIVIRVDTKDLRRKS